MLSARNLNSDQPQEPAPKRKREEEACEELKATDVKKEPTVDENQPKELLSAYHPSSNHPQEPAPKKKRARKGCKKATHVKEKSAVDGKSSKEASSYLRTCPAPQGRQRDLIAKNDQFPTFEAFEKTLEIWKRFHFHPMRKASSEKYKTLGGIGQVNRDKLRYRHVVYHCAHYGKPRKRGEEKRPHQRYMSTGCKALLRVSVDWEKNCLKVSKMKTNHNHPIYDEDLKRLNLSICDKEKRRKRTLRRNIQSELPAENASIETLMDEHSTLLEHWKKMNDYRNGDESSSVTNMSRAAQTLLFEKETEIVKFHQLKFLKQLPDEEIKEKAETNSENGVDAVQVLSQNEPLPSNVMAAPAIDYNGISPLLFANQEASPYLHSNYFFNQQLIAQAALLNFLQPHAQASLQAALQATLQVPFQAPFQAPLPYGNFLQFQ